MKLAHLIIAHTAPEHLLRLIQRLEHPDTDIYIYLDAKTDPSDFEHLRSIENVNFIKQRIPVSWCGYSTVKATLIAMKEILDTGRHYSHINFLSGLDYPLKNAYEVHQFFSLHNDKTFLTCFNVLDEWPDGVARTRRFYLGDYKLPGKHRFQNVINKLPIKRHVPGNLTIYGGSQWLSITPKAAAYVVDHMKTDKKLERYFKMTFASDEIVFQTVLMASPFKETLVNNNLRYIKMSPVTFRPEVLTGKDEEALARSGKLYARKFDTEKSAELLDKLDALVLCHS